MTSEPKTDRVTQDQIAAMSRRAFGANVAVASASELGGGTFNQVYDVMLRDGSRAVLRIAPRHSDDAYWDDELLMRRAHSVQPFFAPVAALMPRTLMTDFTHEVIDRDYVFQSWIDGERWSDIDDDLDPVQQLALWRQCGELVASMHATRGDHFGYPQPGPQYSRWSDTVLDRMARFAGDMARSEMDAAGLDGVRASAAANRDILDHVATPRLLHGDLWTFNLLVDRTDGAPAIVGLIDVDRAWWGDPQADWIMFLTSYRASRPAWAPNYAAYCEGYGDMDESPEATYRQGVYRAMHIASAGVFCARNGDAHGVERAVRELDQLARGLD